MVCVFQPRERDKPPITAVVETKDVPKVDEKGETTHVSIKDKINEDAVTKPKEETPTIEKIGDSLRVRCCHKNLHHTPRMEVVSYFRKWSGSMNSGSYFFFQYYVKNKSYTQYPHMINDLVKNDSDLSVE